MGVQWVYSTSVKDDRYWVKCLIVSGYVKTYRFLVDTGAKYTCCYYKSVDVTLKESNLFGNEKKYITGFVKGSVVKFYKYQVIQFTIGTIDLGEQDIWITFDERVTDAVLGMDVLQRVIFITNPYNKKVYFCRDIDDYNENFKMLK